MSVLNRQRFDRISGDSRGFEKTSANPKYFSRKHPKTRKTQIARFCASKIILFFSLRCISAIAINCLGVQLKLFMKTEIINGLGLLAETAKSTKTPWFLRLPEAILWKKDGTARTIGGVDKDGSEPLGLLLSGCTTGRL